MVFHVMCQMASTGVSFSLWPFHVSLFIVIKEDIRSLLYTAFLATHKHLVPTLVLSRTQSQIRASLPRTLFLSSVGKTLMLSPRIPVQFHQARSKRSRLWLLSRHISVCSTFDFGSQSLGKNISLYITQARRIFRFRCLLPYWITTLAENIC